MSRNIDPNAWGAGYPSRPYRQIYPPEPTTRRRVVTTKDEVQIDEAAGTEVRLPVEDRPPQKITRTTTFGTEVIEVDDHREDHNR